MRSRRITLSALLPLLALALLPGLAAQGRKVALVIGNSAYSSRPLRNPVNDAEDLAAALREIGFSVTLGTDASKKAMYQLVDQFGADIRGADIALFYYSGHGVQSNGENFLIPVGAEISLASDVETEGVQLQRVMGRLNAGGAGTNVVILDACRNNPFPQASKGMEKGLAIVGQKPPESVIVYATEANETADDGSGRNGVFTAALLRNIRRGEELTIVLRDVNAEVRQETNQKQKPAKYDNLTRGIYLAGARGAAPAPSPAVAAPPAASPTLTVTRSYGRLQISAATAGTLYLDGKAMGELPAGAEASLDSIEVGEHSLELRYISGEKESKSATVQKNQASAVVFAWKKPAAALPPVTFPAPAVQAGFVRVPAGSFTMGSPASEKDRGSDEGPQHKVQLSAFSIGQYEVTQAEWQAVMGSNPSNFKGDKLPVECVSWYDILVYCNKRSMKEGLSPCYSISGSTDPARWGSVPTSSKATWNAVVCDFSANGCRLPTEAEWEYAAKGGSAAGSLALNAVYAGSADLDSVAWYTSNSSSTTHPVGHKKANALGLYDMAGNVWEWCWDWYKDTYYSSSPGTDPRGADSGAYRVFRGGSWYNSGGGLRSATRVGVDPSVRYYRNGFRVVVGR